MSNVIVWFHNDLRLGDNPALVKAIESGNKVIPIYIWDENDSDLHTGSAGKWWLYQSLDRLSNRIEELGNKLVLRKGNPKSIIEEFLSQNNISKIFMNRRFEPQIIERDEDILSQIDHEITNGNLLFDPEDIRTKQDKQYTVFTPFWRNCKMQTEPHEPLAIPSEIPEEVLSLLSIDTGYFSTTSGQYDLSYQAIEKGYVGNAKRIEIVEKLPVVDEYRFVKKYFS